MDLVFVFIGATMMGSMIAWIIMIFSHREYISRFDEIMIGHRITADSFPYLILRATDYGFSCTFYVLARRAHPDVDFGSIPDDLKRPFKVMCILLLVGLVCLIVGGVWAEFFR